MSVRPFRSTARAEQPPLEIHVPQASTAMPMSHIDRLAGPLSSAILRLPAGGWGGALDAALSQIVERALLLTQTEVARTNATPESENLYRREEIRNLNGF